MAFLNLVALLPRKAITEDNYSPINVIITWILLVSMLLAVLAKITIKIVYLHSFGPDDAALILALVNAFLEKFWITTNLIATQGARCWTVSGSLCADSPWSGPPLPIIDHVRHRNLREGMSSVCC